MRLLVDERGGVYGAHGEAFAWQIGIDRAEQRVVANVSHREEGRRRASVGGSRSVALLKCEAP